MAAKTMRVLDLLRKLWDIYDQHGNVPVYLVWGTEHKPLNIVERIPDGITLGEHVNPKPKH